MVTARHIIAGVSSLVALITYITCISLSLAKKQYIGGISFPYFSDVGAFSPNYYVFAVGLSITGIGFAVTVLLQYSYVKSLLNGEGIYSKSLSRNNKISVFFGVIGSLAAILVGVFTANEHPDLHNYSAYVFFVFIAIYCLIETIIYKNIAKLVPQLSSSANAQLAWYIIFAIGFVIYLPVGLAIICGFDNLEYSKCIEIKVGDDLCDKYRLSSNDTMTSLYDYTRCPEQHLMRSASQFVCIFAVMVFFGLFAFDPVPADLQGRLGQDDEDVNTAS